MSSVETANLRVTVIQGDGPYNSIVFQPPLSQEQYNATASAVFRRTSDPSETAFADANQETGVTRIKTFAANEKLAHQGEVAVEALAELGLEVDFDCEIHPGY